jgi:hypothetical protein
MSHGVQTVRTPKKRAIVLQALANGLTVSEAARCAGIGRATLYQWRHVDPDFDRECRDAYDDGTDKLEEVARTRAFEGSDLLLMFLLKQRCPERFNKRMVEHAGDINVDHRIAGEPDEVVHFFMPPNHRDEPDTEDIVGPIIDGEASDDTEAA